MPDPFLRFLIGGACLVIIIAGIKATSSIFVIVLFAILIAQCLHPLTAWLRSKKLPSAVAVLISVLVVISTGVAIISIAGSSIHGIRMKLPEYASRISEMSADVVEQLKTRGIDLGATLTNAGTSENIQSIALLFLGELAAIIGNGIFILILVVVLLIEFETISHKVELKKYPDGSFLYRIRDLNNLSSKFIGIQALVGLMQGICSTIVLLVMGVDFSVLWGVLFFFLNFVPVVGFPIAVIMPTVVALMEQGVRQAAIVFIAWYVLNIFFDNVVRPRLLKQSFHVSFIAILLVLLFWTYVLGAAGAILAIPLSLSIKLIYDSYYGKGVVPADQQQ